MKVKLIAAAIVISAGFTMIGAGTAHACESQARRLVKGGSASVCKETTVPPAPPADGSHSELTDEQRYRRYCPTEYYRPGAQVNFIAAADVENAEFMLELFRGETDLDAWVMIRCDGGGFADSVISYIPVGSAPVSVDPVVLREQAKASIVVPDPVVDSSPPFNEPGRFGVVGIPTWFWLNDWESVSETSSQGAVSVTVTAKPVSVSWDPGDGTEPIICYGPGTPWKSGLPEDASNCKHTYKSSSADQPDMQYDLSATVNWSLTWEANGIQQGEFATVQSTTNFTYQVGEIQAIEVE